MMNAGEIGFMVRHGIPIVIVAAIHFAAAFHLKRLLLSEPDTAAA
jgi:hypothetical protein